MVLGLSGPILYWHYQGDVGGDSIHAWIQKVLTEGSNSDRVFLFCFLVAEGREDPNTIKRWPS